MSKSNYTGYVIKIGIVFAILGGVFGMFQSVLVTYNAVTLVFLLSMELSVWHGVVGILVFILSKLLIWLGILAVDTPERKYGWMLIMCSAVAIALSALVVMLTSAWGLNFATDSEMENTITNFNFRSSVQMWRDVPKFLSLGVIGGILLVIGIAKKYESRIVCNDAKIRQ